MSRHWKIRNSWYDKSLGASLCHVDTNIGDFVDCTMTSEEDQDIENSFDGQRFAEYKCRVQYFRKKKNMYRERAIGARNAYKALLQTNDESEPFMVKLKRQVQVAERDAADAKEKYNRLKDNYKTYVEKILSARRDARKQ